MNGTFMPFWPVISAKCLLSLLHLAVSPPYLPEEDAHPISSVPIPAYQVGNPPACVCMGFAIVGKTVFMSVTGTISQAIASRKVN